MRRAQCCLFAASLAVSSAFAAENECRIAVDDTQSRLTVEFAGQPLLVYAFAPNQFKPYVRDLYTLGGVNLLRDAPADHLHHHGLMYAIRVNGVNFWEEQNSPGHERSVKLLAHRSGKNPKGQPQASFSQLIHWVTHTNARLADTRAAALLVETRTISVTVNPSSREVALDWQSDFEVGSAAVKLTGSSYNGLGLRLPKDFDHVAVHQNSGNAPYSAAASGDVTPAKWSAVSGQVAGRTASAALFSLPSNRGEARFFTMLNAFAYLAVTQNLEKQPLEYAAGEKFRLRYLLTAYDEKKSADFLNRRHAQWLDEAK